MGIPLRVSQALLDFSDRRWAEQIRAGDVQAFEAVFHRLAPGLCVFVAQFVGARDVAEDLVQDLFLTLWRQREAFDVRASLVTYLYAAARNRALNYLKHERIILAWQNTPRGRDEYDGTPVDADLLEAELSLAVQNAIERLPERSRLVFNMSRRSGMTYAQIAAALNISVKTVEAQMGRAMRLIRARLREAGL